MFFFQWPFKTVFTADSFEIIAFHQVDARVFGEYWHKVKIFIRKLLEKDRFS